MVGYSVNSHLQSMFQFLFQIKEQNKWGILRNARCSDSVPVSTKAPTPTPCQLPPKALY